MALDLQQKQQQSSQWHVQGTAEVPKCIIHISERISLQDFVHVFSFH